MIYGLIVLAVGILMVRQAAKLRRRLEKYEFENRTDGGVVKFDSYEDSLRHRRAREKGGMLINVGVLLIIGGTIWAVIGFLVARYHL